MNEVESTCDELVIATERALHDENLAKLFLVSEHVNIDKTASIVIRRWVHHYSHINIVSEDAIEPSS